MPGEEDSQPASQLGMCNREIVRRGALILFCDYVVSVDARGGGDGERGQWRSAACLPPAQVLLNVQSC